MSKTYDEIKAEMEEEINEYFNPSERKKGFPTINNTSGSTTAVGYGTVTGREMFRKFYPSGKYIVVGDQLLNNPQQVRVFDGDERATIAEGQLGIPTITHNSNDCPKIQVNNTGCAPVDAYNNIYHPEEKDNDFNDL